MTKNKKTGFSELLKLEILYLVLRLNDILKPDV